MKSRQGGAVLAKELFQEAGQQTQGAILCHSLYSPSLSSQVEGEGVCRVQPLDKLWVNWEVISLL